MRRIAGAVVLVALISVGTSCGDDDGEDPGDEASFCRLASDADPVAEADLSTLERLQELAPVEIRDQVGVLVDLAAQVDEVGAESADALAIEFEVRFSDEYVAARRDVESYQRDECRDEVARVTTSSSSTTSTTSSTTDEAIGGDDG